MSERQIKGYLFEVTCSFEMYYLNWTDLLCSFERHVTTYSENNYLQVFRVGRRSALLIGSIMEGWIPELQKNLEELRDDFNFTYTISEIVRVKE
jgi:hypothetical protein